MPKTTWWTALTIGLVLAATGCPDKKPRYPTCNGDKDCKPGEKCVNKRCVRCATDADCGPGQTCVDGACQATASWCSSDGDCDDGKVCRDNTCVPCQADADCGEGGRCIDGGCLRKGQCRTDDDCPEDEDCVNGVCTRAYGGNEGGMTPRCTLEVVYFGFDQYALDDAAKAILQRNVECLSTTPRRVAVIGMTDPRGPDEYNISLSDNRAQAVITYLVRMGVDAGRLRKVPRGEADAVGTDEASWSRDRRVELSWD